MMIPLEVLNKPTKLTDEEFVEMKKHVVYSRQIVSQIEKIPQTSLLISAQHHERYDGTGYPEGLKGDEISKGGQMAAIVDVYDAITSDRCYRNGMEPVEGLRKLFEWSKFHFNAELVQKFIKCAGLYPVGTLIRLESGFLAVIVEPGQESLLHPIVRVVYDTKKKSFMTPRDIDLSRLTGKNDGDRVVGHESPRKWRIEPRKYLNLI